MALNLATLNYNQLKKALATGQVTEKQIKRHYSDIRKTAVSRQRNVLKKAGDEFGEIEKETFVKVRDIITTDQLLRETADINKYLRSSKSTITGLKFQREKIIEKAEELGFDIDEDTYTKWLKFMNWFKNSEFSKVYDSSSEEVAEAFNAAERATPEDWRKAFEVFNGAEDKRKRY